MGNKIIYLVVFFTLILVGCSSKEKKSGIDLIKSKAYFYYKKRNYDSSSIYFTYLIQLDSLNGEYYFKRGYSNSILLKDNESLNDYLKAAKLNYQPAKAFYNIGINYSYNNDSLALKYFEMCYEIDTSDLQVQNKISECKNRLKNE